MRVVIQTGFDGRELLNISWKSGGATLGGGARIALDTDRTGPITLEIVGRAHVLDPCDLVNDTPGQVRPDDARASCGVPER
jgi:hypothetical protein